MSIWLSVAGVGLAIIGIALIIRSAIGIRKQQGIAFGGDRSVPGAHDHKAVKAGLVRIGLGFFLFVFGMFCLAAGIHDV